MNRVNCNLWLTKSRIFNQDREKKETISLMINYLLLNEPNKSTPVSIGAEPKKDLDPTVVEVD